MQRSDYNYAALPETAYEAIISAMEVFTDANGKTIISPLHGTANWQTAAKQCQTDNVDLRVDLAALLFEDHGGTDPEGGTVLASVYNFGGIKWAEQSGAYDSGIPCPPKEGGTYAGFYSFGDFLAALHRTLNNQYCGPSFRAGDLVRAWAIYVGGADNPNMAAGQARVDQWQYYVKRYPPQGAQMGIYGSAVVTAALAHLGETHEWDAWNGDHPVSMLCQADVEDWYTEAGCPVPHYPTAAAAGDAFPLSSGHAPAGAQVFLRGQGWSIFDHTGVSLGDGRTISGLANVVITSGWQDLPSYRGYRFPNGVIADETQNVFYIPGNPFGAIPLVAPFWNRWNALDQLGLALPQLGYAVRPLQTQANGRRVQQFQRGWLGTQEAPDPWDCVVLLPNELPA